MAKVWVTGAAGLIGNEIVRGAGQWATDHEVIPITRTELDLTDLTAIESRFQADDPDAVIHCAAMSRPVDCAQQPELARRVNVDATGKLAELFADRFLLYFSTDLVLDGAKGDYTEEDPPNPLHDYGKSKLAGEEVVRPFDHHAIVRSALTFGTSLKGDRAFNEQMRGQLQAGQNFTLFDDEYRCPLNAEVTARAVWELMNLQVGGVFLLGGPEKVSRWQIGKALYDRWGDVSGTIKPGSLKDYDGPPRAADLSMNCRKLQALLSFPLPGFHEWLAANPDAKV
ncbi:MAG: SDR family oxidoreductase [Limisphaerales bacterium]